MAPMLFACVPLMLPRPLCSVLTVSSLQACPAQACPAQPMSLAFYMAVLLCASSMSTAPSGRFANMKV